jgi:hypothetical protein
MATFAAIFSAPDSQYGASILFEGRSKPTLFGSPGKNQEELKNMLRDAYPDVEFVSKERMDELVSQRGT